MAAPVAAAGLSAWAAVHPRSQLFGPTVRHAGETCALTFDDGPNPAITPQLLDLLDKHRVRATFFVLGKYVRELPALTADIAARGHVLGNHTDTHPSLVFFSRKHILDELARCEDAVVNATGQRPMVVRPPFGFRGPTFVSTARQAGLSKVVMWSVSGNDWNPQPYSRVAHRLRKAGPGDIILLHDGDHRASNADRSHTVKALEFWLPRWHDAGLSFGAIQ
jgi:peptidoglycan/xylan/chitin deacetylase (PgdA/CDA1 family)